MTVILPTTELSYVLLLSLDLVRFPTHFSNKISQMTGLQLDKNISGQSHECSLRSNDDYSNFLSFTILDS